MGPGCFPACTVITANTVKAAASMSADASAQRKVRSRRRTSATASVSSARVSSSSIRTASRWEREAAGRRRVAAGGAPSAREAAWPNSSGATIPWRLWVVRDE